MPVPQPARRIYRFGPFCLDPAARLLVKEGQPIPLQPKVFDTLVLLVENAGRPVDKDTLLRTLWPDTFVEEENLAHNISVLRKTLGEAPGGRPWIETLRKRGYHFVGQVALGWPESSSADSAIAAAPQAAPPTRRWPRVAKAGTVPAAVMLTALAVYLLLHRGPEPILKNATFIQLTDQPGQELFPSLSPDGNSFVYASRASGNWDIYLQRVGGKTPINLTADCSFDDTEPAFSLDGQQIAFRSERGGGGIFVMGATGESVKRVTDLGYNPAWSPDGKQIVFATEGFVRPGFQYTRRSRLFVADVSTGEKRPLTPETEHAVQPSWSPHGHRIAYWSARLSRGSVRTVAAAGGKTAAVTADPCLDWNPVWSPDGRYLYFSSNRAGSMNLWRAAIAEQTGHVIGRPEPVTTPSPYSGHISLSRDGRRIAFIQEVRRSNIHRVEFDSKRETVMGQPVPVTQGTREVIDPALSPDGQWLAFSSRGTQEDIFVIRTDGTGMRQLTNDPYRKRSTRWSPDGKHITFHYDRTGKCQVWTMNPDGSGLQQLTYQELGDAMTPFYSPDGSRLVYSIHGGESFVMEVQRPWNEQSPIPLGGVDAAGWFVPFCWSSDNRRLAGHKRGLSDGVPAGVFTYSFETRTFERLTNSGTFPHWLSDNQRLLFNDGGQLKLVDSRSKRIRELLSVAPDEVYVDFAHSRDDRTIYFSRAVTEADIWMMSLK